MPMIGRLSLACALAAALGAAACDDPSPTRDQRPTSTASSPSASPTGASPSAAAPHASAVTTAAALAPEPMGDAARGKQLAVAHECHRCHGGLELDTVIPTTSHCFQCHQSILAGKLDHKPDAPRWRKNVAHLAAVPSLADLGARVQYEWLVRYLSEPHDLRPALEPTMPRLGLTREEARDLAAFLIGSPQPAAPEKDALAGADLKRGRKLLDELQCGACHRMSGVEPLAASSVIPPDGHETRAAVMLAPDLSLVRGRMSGGQLVRWLLDPLAVKRDALMPQTPMTPEQARDIAAYILTAPLALAAQPPIPAALPLLDRRVTYAEVEERVLGKTCRHCHGDPDEALGDGGPGNTGGFGFKARGVSFSSYEQAQAGYLDDAGERHSFYEPFQFVTHPGEADAPKATPRLIAALWARYREVAGNPDPSIRGMPLGLPPLPPEDIQLLATWVAQGRPRK